LNPLTGFGLKRFAPEQYGRLIGKIPAARGGPIIEPGTPSAKPGTKSISGKGKRGRIGRGHFAAMTVLRSAVQIEAARIIPPVPSELICVHQRFNWGIKILVETKKYL
jgi:hypothetical protein